MSVTCRWAFAVVFFAASTPDSSRAQLGNEDLESLKQEIEAARELMKSTRSRLDDLDRKVNDQGSSLWDQRKGLKQLESQVGIQKQLNADQQKGVIERIRVLDEAFTRENTETKASFTELDGQLSRIKEDVPEIARILSSTKSELDRFWILISAAIVFFMQSGFMAFEIGMVRAHHRTSVGLKNLVDWTAVSFVFYVLGFGIMFGESSHGWFGATMFAPSHDEVAHQSDYGLEFFLFQLAFAGTAATIVSGAIAERARITAYLISSLTISAIIYPLFGFWAWGHIFFESNRPWLANLGFHDFAGGTVVHSIGGWVALVGVIVVRSRPGRFRRGSEARFYPSDLAFAVLGVFILWFGWWGFNGGSVLGYDEENVAVVILNTNLAAAAAGLTGLLTSLFAAGALSDARTEEHLKMKAFLNLVGGSLGGLVAITPCCNVVTTLGAVLVGIGAGLVQQGATWLLERFQADDPVGAVAVHGFCGAFGTLAVGILASPEQIGRFELCNIVEGQKAWNCVHAGLLYGGGVHQLGAQLVGVAAAFLLAVICASVVFKTLEVLGILMLDYRIIEEGLTSVGPPGKESARVLG